MINLLDETVEAIRKAGKSRTDVNWVGTIDGEYYCSMDHFAQMAETFDYDNGYGGQEVRDSLVVVFTDGSWLERGEYNGAEWWEYKAIPILEPDSGALILLGHRDIFED